MRGKLRYNMSSFSPDDVLGEVGGVEGLKKIDVYKILSDNSEDAVEIAEYIAENRPDLKFEVNHLLNLHGNSWS